jgi:uncharacterized delta-60 repeat protein
MMEWNSLRRIGLPFIAACAALAACSASTTTNTTVLPATAIATLRFNSAGVRDTTFAGGKGIAITDFETGLNDYALATALQPDGSIVVAGASGKTQPSGAQLLIAVARYNSNGTPDTTFGTGGGAVRTTIGTDHAEGDALALQADGKIVVAATIFSSTFSGKGIALLRYNGTDGTLDTGFNGTGIVTTTIGTGFDTAAAAVVVQSDQKIVVAGHANMTNGQTNTILLRYNTNGMPDATFGTNGLITTPLSDDSMALGMVLQSDGKIVVTGSLGAGSNPLDTIVLRYNSDGTLDSGFGSGGVARFDVGGNDFGNAVALQTDGNIVVTGHARVDFFSDTSDIAVLRIKGTDGTLDTSFGSGGTVIVNLGAFDNAFSVVLQTDGKIVVSGNSGSGSVTRAAVVRFNTDGTLDAGFGSGGIVTPVAAGPSLTASGNAVVFQPADGSIYVTGYD